VRARTAELETSNLRLESEIEARKTAEERISAALQEKVILLSEIHHRVKNNLQIVHSLLDLQMTQIEDAAVRDMLQDNKDRIRSMALIHQSLYQSKNFAQVDIGDVLKKLVADIAASQGLDQRPVRIKIHASSVLLSMNAAIPCGLIANELITNALKHGFPDQSTGTVAVALTADRNQQVILDVSDNGVGISEDIDLDSAQTLGLELITLLTDQLSGQLTIQRANPTRFVVRFPLEQGSTQKE
jgi:two-component sensor histidine kinase